MGRHGFGVKNENGELFIDFCTQNGLVIGGTTFIYKKNPQNNVGMARWGHKEPN
jgi:hypothetical protein